MTPTTWIIRADRRTIDLDALYAELDELGHTLDGLQLRLHPREQVQQAPDSGTFRDFTPVATASATHPAVLEALAEELLHTFGFQVDVLKTPPPL